MERYFLGIDQGTTGVTAVLFDRNWHQVARGYREIKQYYPQNGWVEHDANDIWNAVCSAVEQALHSASVLPEQILCIGLDHEGESMMLWDKQSGKPLGHTIVWQDRRTTETAIEVNAKDGEMIRKRTGLSVDSYFSALKLKWLLEHTPECDALLASNRLLAGTMDTWILWKMTSGRVHATDVSTASRTMLMNLTSEVWDNEVLSALKIPEQILPVICDSNTVHGNADPASFCGISSIISGVLTDQQAALFGQSCTAPGSVKTTYGTGCFMLMNTGDHPVYSQNGLVTTVAWRLNGKTTYALDGGIYIAGAATQWLRDGLQIINSAEETEAMAHRVPDNGGVYFVPAFTGLAAPHWDSYARGTILGITGATTREHIARAALESTAYQVYDLLRLMEADFGASITTMRCDGGAAQNRFLMQFQADITGIPLSVPVIIDRTALGSARMAAIGAGFCKADEDFSQFDQPDTCYVPRMNITDRDTLLRMWHRAVDRSKQWIND